MKLITTAALFIGLTFGLNNLSANEQRQIELNDNTVITGEIVSFSNGIYTVKSAALGTIEIEDSKVRAIQSVQPQAIQSGESISLDNLQSLKNMMMNDQDIMGIITSLQSDPQFQAALQDPEIVSAVSSGDLNVLLANPAFLKLLEHQKVKEIAKQLEEK